MKSKYARLTALVLVSSSACFANAAEPANDIRSDFSERRPYSRSTEFLVPIQGAAQRHPDGSAGGRNEYVVVDAATGQRFIKTAAGWQFLGLERGTDHALQTSNTPFERTSK